MQPATALPQIKGDQPNGALSERGLIGALTDDDTAYNNLAVRHNALVKHVQEYCQ